MLSCNDVDAEVDAARMLEQLCSFSAVPHIRRDQLEPPLIPRIVYRQGMYLYYCHRTEQPRRIRLFLDFVVRNFERRDDLALPESELA